MLELRGWKTKTANVQIYFNRCTLVIVTVWDIDQLHNPSSARQLAAGVIWPPSIAFAPSASWQLKTTLKTSLKHAMTGKRRKILTSIQHSKTDSRRSITQMSMAFTYLYLAQLGELFAQVGGVLLKAVQVELHLQAADTVHCVRRWRWHQS